MAAQINHSAFDADLRDTPLRNLIAASAALLLFTWTPLAMWTAGVVLDGVKYNYWQGPGAGTNVEILAFNDYAVGGAFIAAGLLPLLLMIGAYRHPRLLLVLEVAALLDGISMFWLA